MSTPTPAVDLAPYQYFHKVLVHIHNVIRRSTNSLIQHAETVTKPKDIKNFLGYAHVYHDVLHHHHHHEEEFMFPLYEKKGNKDVSGFLHDHSELISHLTSLESKIKGGLADPSTYNAAEFKANVTTIKDMLFPHLKEEEDQSTPELLSPCLPADELIGTLKAIEAENMKNSSPFRELAFLGTHLTNEERAFFFSDMPWFVRSVLLRFVFPLKLSAYWKYSMTV